MSCVLWPQIPTTAAAISKAQCMGLSAAMIAKWLVAEHGVADEESRNVTTNGSLSGTEQK